jgi:pimeloyl-ACP methyl ester carboxylesterase
MVSPATTTADPVLAEDVVDFSSKMHVELTGPEDARPLLVLPGWGSSAAVMRAAVAALQGDFRVHSLDLPGHGRTPPPPTAWGVPEYAALVAEYVRRHGLAPVSVLAHSNGGRIALYMASDTETAALFSRLALVSPSGVTPPRGPAYYLRRAWASLLKAPFMLLPDGDLRRRALDWLRSTIYWRLIASGDYQAAGPEMRETFVRTVNFHVDERLGQVRVPVLVIWGDRDTAVVRRQVDVMVERIPDAGLVVLPGAGHYGFIDAPAAYASAVRSFLTPPSA